MSRSTKRRPLRAHSLHGVATSRGRIRFAPASEPLEGRTLMTVGLLKDINTLDSYPAQITDVGGTAYFVSKDAGDGYNLWRSEGTPETTVVLRNYPNAGISGNGLIPQNLTDIGGRLFLTIAESSGTPVDLESVDPITGAVDDFGQLDFATTGYSPFHLTDVGGKAVFQTVGINSDRRIVASDGTAAGTVVLKSGISYALSDDSTAKLGASLVFVAADSTGNPAIWKTDGTPAGTVQVSTLPPMGAGGRVRNLATLGGAVFFQTVNSTGVSDFWSTDGTAAGTTKIATGLVISDKVVSAGGKVYFQGYSTPQSGLFVSDGTAAGTVYLGMFGIGGGSGPVTRLTAAGSKVYFVATDSDFKTNVLWTSDGTVGGTSALGAIQLGPEAPTDISYLRPPLLQGVGTGVFFAAYDATHGVELWHSDGTTSGTAMVEDINLGADGSAPAGLASVGGRVAFAAHDGTGANQLWFSDGTASGTVMASALPDPHDQGSFTPQNGSNADAFNSSPDALTIGDTTYFVASDPDHGQELWKTDGTATGTVLVKDVRPGPEGSDIFGMTDLGGILLFFARDGSGLTRVWRSDGTTDGTSAVGTDYLAHVTSGARFALLGGWAYFFGQGSAGGQGLWRTDGTVAATKLVANVANTHGPTIGGDLTVFGSRLYFATADQSHGRELWSSDGTAAGTALVKDIDAGAGESQPQDLTVAGSTLYFTADDGIHGRELWKTDGTDAGTTLVKDLYANSGSSSPSSLTAAGPRLFFLADAGAAGKGLWTTTGTAASTVLLQSYGPDAYLGMTGFLAAIGSELYFAIRDGQDQGLYRSDGSFGGTSKVASPKGLVVGPIYALGDAIYFPVANSDLDAQGNPAVTYGDFLYRSDGTGTNTVNLARIGPYNADTPPQPVRVFSNGDVLTFGDDGFHGVEPLRVNGTAAANRPPTLYRPPPRTIVLGQTARIEVTATDPDPGQPIRYTLGANAPDGAAIDASTGAFTWTPTAAEGASTYVIDVIATDTGTPAASSVGTITIVVLPNSAPVLDAISPQSVTQNVPLTFVAHATDPDAGQTITYSLGAGAPTGATIDPVTGRFSWTPSTSQGPGVFSITVNSTDDGLPARTDTRSVTISVAQANRAPVLAAIPDQTIPQLATLRFTAAATDPDTNQTLTYSLDPGAIVGATLDSRTGEFAWTPGSAQAIGTYTITVRVSDDGKPIESDSRTVKIAVTAANRAPILAPIADHAIPQSAPLTLVAAATDPDAGQTITYSLGTGAPDGATIDSTSGRFSWTPTTDQGPGKIPITIVATDSGLPARSASRTFTVTVSRPNQAPSLDPIDDLTLNEGQVRTLTAIGSDPDVLQSWHYSLDAGAPAWASIDPALGRITLQPGDNTGAADITVRVTDNGSPVLSVARSFHVTVANVAPIVSLDASDASLTVGAALVRTGRFADPGRDSWTATVDYGDGSGSAPLALAADRSFTLSHAFASAGVYTVSVSVIDKDGGVGTASFKAGVAAPKPASVPGVVRFANPVVTVDESAGTARIEVLFTPGTNPTGEIAIGTGDGTGHAGQDYVATIGVVSFAAGETSTFFTVPIIDRGLSTGEKSVSVFFRDPTGTTIPGTPDAATLVIRDNDPVSPPVTVGPVRLESKAGRIADLVLPFSAAVDRPSAEDLNNYHLASLVRNRRGALVSKPIALASAAYDDATHTVRLAPAGRLATRGNAILTITPTGIHDRFGRGINGGNDIVDRLRLSVVKPRHTGPAGRPRAMMANAFRR